MFEIRDLEKALNKLKELGYKNVHISRDYSPGTIRFIEDDATITVYEFDRKQKPMVETRIKVVLE